MKTILMLGMRPWKTINESDVPDSLKLSLRTSQEEKRKSYHIEGDFIDVLNFWSNELDKSKVTYFGILQEDDNGIMDLVQASHRLGERFFG